MTYIGELKNTMTKGGKRFYITFIDDYSRYTRVYLLRNKDKAMTFIKYKNEVENQQLQHSIILKAIGNYLHVIKVTRKFAVKKHMRNRGCKGKPTFYGAIMYYLPL